MKRINILFALLIPLLLTSCFESEVELIPAEEATKLFGSSGSAIYVKQGSKDRTYVTYAWNGSGYDIQSDFGKEGEYRIVKFDQEYLLVQATEKKRIFYALAKIKDNKLLVYTTDCAKISDKKLSAKLVLDRDKEGICKVSDYAQLKSALADLAKQKLDLIRIYAITRRK